MVAEHGCPRDRGVWPPQEQIPEKICEQIADVHVPQVVEQTIEVPKMAEQILDVPVPEMVEQLTEMPETVSQDRIKQRTVEQIVDAPVLQAVEELAEVSKVFSQDRIQQRIVEQTIPAIPLAEKIVKLPVIQTEGTTQQGVNTHVQHVVNPVEVEKSEIIEETRQKPIIQEKINQVTKHVEIPELQFTDKVVDVPVVAQKQISMTLIVQKNIEISQLQIDDKVVDVPVIQVMPETAEIPQLPLVKKIGVACLTCDAKYKVACETCVKDNTVMVAREITVTEKIDHETVVQSVVRKIGIESFIDDLSSVDSKGLNYQDCEVPLHVNKQRTNITDSVHVGKDELNDDAHLRHARDETENAEFLTDLMATRLEKNLVNVPVVTWRTAAAAAAAQRRSTQQQQRNKPQQQAMQGREEGKKGRETVRKGERGKEEERDAEEEGDTQVKKDVTGWTVVTRNKRQRKMVQIFVKVDEAKVTPMDVSLTDGKVEDVIRQVQKGEDVYVTMQGKVLRRNEKLKSCGVTDGCTIQVTSRMRGGGRHKDKRSKTDTKRGMDESGQKDQQVESLIDKCREVTQAQKDEMIQLFEENDAYRRMITMISEAEDEEHEIQCFRKQLQSGLTKKERS